MPLFTVQIINSVDAVTQQKVFRQGRDATGIFILKILLAVAQILGRGRQVLCKSSGSPGSNLIPKTTVGNV